ncbi:RepB family DNA primase [Bradyrhizobium diazoefficiens]|uniref:NrS-1 polymerase-like helicase domain-containing protein n=1 Tax=Bradyrhizobium diazoefficiens SEMIA 5080 TaxID=754504 RepID=A0A837C8Y6_9BRAD|nr:DUF5906 domain-containing protein [Bradyrhizobium diazoefficiens]APO49863.1 hypothetical protein BD122_06480 [Bradyrhizobium diazoefficiens]KGJ65707.1 hypothetical protein BJA5080_02352 [Bradyrhizobium diazoefficiens SEMIA 5080]MCD9295790.1 RepB family DNA primase [Bradyrhizobium diazoefficiens]MCD9810299.1 RepB family DNA primase [Bradyrhizobium diazoefficiens]MCD9828199.1 RepB family DNA primase [Bradyrhizobium diazoefficiens]
MSNDATGAAATPDNQAAADFLKLVYPEGPWVLTAIRTDRKAIETRTFRPTDVEALLSWLKQHNGERNIYWSVNPPLRALSKKADREDIKEVAYLHVDIDPRAGEYLASERVRCAALLTDHLPSGIPQPTAVVFSGGGYQGFWKLDAPIPINGDLSLAEDAKRYNQQLELVFGGDNCHNIDRIMRLPGTINVPDERKRRKGREPELATLISWVPENVYTLDKFTPAPAVQSPDLPGLSSGPSKVQVGGNIERLADIVELDRWNVPDRVKVICVQGKDPEEPKESDNSRSQWVFDVCCQLVRCKVPDQVIFSILTDPDYGISESILEKASSAEKYAIRQIERAHDEVIDPWLRKLNEEYAVVKNIGGKCRVIEEVMDPVLNRSRLTRISFDDFRNSYMNKKVQAGVARDGTTPRMVPVGRWWLEHPDRREFKTIVFAPNKEVPNSYNLWKGYGCEARPGDCSLFLDHIKRNICSNDETTYRYLLGWLARAVQQPASQGEVAIVLRGGRGVGKSFFAKHFGALFGRHYLMVSNSSHLVGNFNSHLRDVVVLFADEAFYAGDKKHGPILKTLITEETITIEAKGVDVESCPNYVHLIMASNEDHVVPAGLDERRYLVLNVSAEQQQKKVYFRAIKEQLDAGGYEALLHLLLTYDLTDYEVRDVPSTAALDEQKAKSLPPLQDWLHKLAQSGEVPAPEPGTPMQAIRRKWRMISSTEIVALIEKHYKVLLDTREIKALLGEKGMGLTHQRKENIHGFALPHLSVFRQKLNEVLNLKLPFDDPAEDFTGIDFDYDPSPF